MMNKTDTLLRDLDSLGVADEIEFLVNIKKYTDKFQKDQEYKMLQKWNDKLTDLKIINVRGKVERHVKGVSEMIAYNSRTSSRVQSVIQTNIKYIIKFNNQLELQLNHKHSTEGTDGVTVFGLVKDMGFHEIFIQSEVTHAIEIHGTVAEVVMKMGAKYFPENIKVNGSTATTE